jgi:hypothetical protein
VVHIDRLVLRGFRHEDRHRIAEELREEIGRRLAEPEAARRMASRQDAAHLDVATVRVAPGASPAKTAAKAAHNIARGLTR